MMIIQIKKYRDNNNTNAQRKNSSKRMMNIQIKKYRDNNTNAQHKKLIQTDDEQPNKKYRIVKHINIIQKSTQPDIKQ